jgi:dienelactone hydrolase
MRYRDRKLSVCVRFFVRRFHGADDPYESKGKITAFHQSARYKKADWQMIYYSNAVHGFTNPEYGNDNSKGAAYNEKRRNSFDHLKLFLNEVLNR